MPDQTCLFCQINERKIPATIRFEDENWLAFDDIHKAAPEHIIIIPKKHYTTLEEVPASDSNFHSQLLLTARKIAQQIGIQANYKLFMNVGEKVQMIHHLHLHLLGGWKQQTTVEKMEQDVAKLVDN